MSAIPKSTHVVGVLSLALVGLWLWSPWADQGALDSPVKEESGVAEDARSVPGAPKVASANEQPVEVEVPSLSEEEALRGSIKSISCFPEFAGKDVLSTDELTPTREGIQAMEGCLDLVGARQPEEAAIELTTVFYLSPDGSVFETGVGADVGSLEAWDILEPCAREYWLANAPKVRASDEKSFSCVYSWSAWSLLGGVHRVGAQVPSVLSGRGSVAFGTSVTGAVPEQ